MKNKEIFVVLDNIRSTLNVGSIFRTADACGISKIFLVGVTPSPIDRFGRERKDIAKAALGAEKNIAWEPIENLPDLISKMKKDGVMIVAVEQSLNSIDYKKVKIKYPVCFIFGNEVNGVSPEILAKCDIVAEIPMRGKKESLNVSVAFGVVMFRLLGV